MFALSVVPSIHGMGGLRSGAAGVAVGRGGYGYGVSASMLEAGPVRFLRGKAGLGVELVSGFAFGVGGTIGRWSFPRYTPLLEWEGAIGVQLRSDQMTTGIQVTARGQEGRPFSADRMRVIVGGEVRLSEAVMAIAEVAEGERLEVQTGTRVRVIEEMSFILSWSDGTSSVGGGCEITVGWWQLLTAVRWHPILGWTHGVTLGRVWR